MPGVGVGGLISNFLNPGLNDQVARVMTPNAAPLAQQAAPDGQAGANMTPSVAPAPDPVNSQYIGTLLKASQQAAYAADLNRDFAGIAAGFGTAQQQHDKQAALGAGGGGADYLGQLKTMQGMQENTIADNEHARFQANAAVFAQSMSQALGRPVSIAEATEWMNNPDTMKMVTGAAGANMQTPDKLKEVDAATRAYAEGNPGASPQDIAQFRANLLSNAALGGDSKAREYMQAKQAWLNDPANKGKPLPPELETQVAFEQQKAGGLADTVAKAKDLVADQHNFTPALANYDKTLEALNEFMTPAMQEGAKEFLGSTGQYTPVAAMDDKGKKAYSLYKQIMAAQFSAGVQDFKGAGRITQQELNQDAPSQSTMGQLNQSPEDFQAAVGKYRDQLMRRRAGLFGAAQKSDDPRLSDEDYAQYVAPNIDVLGGKRRPNDFSQMSDADAEAAVKGLSSGAKFIGPDGQVHTRK